MLPAIGGIIAIPFGYLLFKKGVTGEWTLVVESDYVNAHIYNAAPGLVVMMLGLAVLFVVAWRRVKIRYTNKRSGITLMANTKRPSEQSHSTIDTQNDR